MTSFQKGLCLCVMQYLEIGCTCFLTNPHLITTHNHFMISWVIFKHKKCAFYKKGFVPSFIFSEIGIWCVLESGMVICFFWIFKHAIQITVKFYSQEWRSCEGFLGSRSSGSCSRIIFACVIHLFQIACKNSVTAVFSKNKWACLLHHMCSVLDPGTVRAGILAATG